MIIAAVVLLGLMGGGVYFWTKAEQLPESAKAGGPQGTAAKQVAAMASEATPGAVLAGAWSGASPWTKDAISFDIKPDGTFTASFDASGTWTEKDGLFTLAFGGDGAGARYEGRIDGDVFSGTSTNGEGEAAPFKLERKRQ
jgi:hypothetical protein